MADSRGYVLLAKGGSDAGVKWRYRVVCKDGAFVRHGIELTSPLLFNLPWHSIVEVKGFITGDIRAFSDFHDWLYCMIFVIGDGLIGRLGQRLGE